MLSSRRVQVLYHIVAAFLLVAIPVGCATGTHGSSVEGKFFVPSTVSPPDNVPTELQPYLIRFEQILEFYGFKVGTTSDSQAFQLRLEYTGEAGSTKVAAILMQNHKPVLEAFATPRTWVPWEWFTVPSNKDELVAKLVDDTAHDFDDRLRQFMLQVRIAREQGTIAPPGPEGSGIIGFGTAFAVNTSNTYMTALHVVAGASKIELYCDSDKSAPASIESIDIGNDLAVLHSDMKAEAFLELAPNDSTQLGDHVFTMGFPTPDILGVAPKYTEGVVSSLSGFGDTKSLMQITVQIQPGNSGGPLVDTHGRVVGVITSTAAVSSFFHNTGALPQNINFAVSSYYAYPLTKDIPLSGTDSIEKLPAIKRVTESICLVVVEATNQ